jgi:hypothetical protein
MDYYSRADCDRWKASTDTMTREVRFDKREASVPLRHGTMVVSQDRVIRTLSCLEPTILGPGTPVRLLPDRIFNYFLDFPLTLPGAYPISTANW